MLNRVLKYGIPLALLTAALAGCQQETNSAQERFQQKAEIQLAGLTNRYSSGFARKASSGSRGAVGDWDSSVAPWGQGNFGGQAFYPRVDQRAQQCVQMLRSIPQTRATYGAAMIQEARCLNSILQERNPLLTWGYNAGSDLSQNYVAYGNGWPQWGGFNQFNSFTVYQPWLGNGFAFGNGNGF